MDAWLAPLLSEEILFLLFALSILTFIASLITIPYILIRLPQHYFDERHPRTWMENHHPLLRLTGRVLKNIIGAVFLLAGLAMLVLPGQGILTMLIGISLLDVPGKRRLERKLISQPQVFQGVNAIRRRFGRPPLVIEEAVKPS